jgi:predicted alpha/beta hydrolase
MQYSNSIVMNLEKHAIKTQDSFELKARLYLPDSAPIGIVICNAGTCIRQDFYQKTALFLAEQGLAALTYDYRGVGESRPANLRGFKAKISDWGRWDMPAVFDWANQRFPNLPKYLLAHSMGGQIIGLNEEITGIDKIVTVASSYGNHQFYEPSFRKMTQKGLIPMRLAEWWYGFIPARLIGGEDWAVGISREWRDWSTYQIPFSEIAQKKGWKTYFDRITQPFRAYFIADDKLATAQTIPYYQQDFQNAPLEVITLKPEQQAIGHFGFFTGRVELSVWEDVVTWLRN